MDLPPRPLPDEITSPRSAAVRAPFTSAILACRLSASSPPKATGSPLVRRSRSSAACISTASTDSGTLPPLCPAPRWNGGPATPPSGGGETWLTVYMM